MNLTKSEEIKYLRERNAKLEIKIKKYESVLRQLLEEEEEKEIDNNNNNRMYSKTCEEEDLYWKPSSNNFEDLEESIIFERDKDGVLSKKINSDIGESFIIMDEKKDLKEINKKEYNTIKEQENLHQYNKGSSVLKKLGPIYTVGSTTIKYGKYLFGLL